MFSSSQSGNRRVSVSLPRRFVIDLLHFSKQIPTLPMQRTMQLQKVVAERSLTGGCGPRGQKICWSAIFIRAFALLAQRHPEFRRAYVKSPWPVFYESGVSVASFSVEREYQGEQVIVYGQVVAPEQKTLKEIDAAVRKLQHQPLDEVASFQAALRLSRLPMPLRRFVWWLGLNDGAAKAHFFGTFGISVVASYGAASLTLLSPVTSTINYGVFQEDGSLDVRVMYDHRVMDGAFVARSLVELEQILVTEVAGELAGIASDSEPSVAQTVV